MDNKRKRALYESILKCVSVEVKKYLNEKISDDADSSMQKVTTKNLNTRVQAIKFRTIEEVRDYINKNCSKTSRINKIFSEVHGYFPYDNEELTNLFNFNATVNQMRKLYSLRKYESMFDELFGTISEMLLLLACGLVQNNLPKSAYKRALLYGQGFNPYDYSWYEEGVGDTLLEFIEEYPEYFDLAYEIAEKTGDDVKLINIFNYASELDELWG